MALGIPKIVLSSQGCSHSIGTAVGGSDALSLCTIEEDDTVTGSF